MMDAFLDHDGGTVLLSLVQAVRENAARLSKLDGAIGDGDHGINMSKGFTLCGDRLRQNPFGLLLGLKTLGEVLVTEIGGAMGPLYGTFFTEMAMAGNARESIDAQLFSAMLDRGVVAVQELGEARVGDKTMIDVLMPAAEELRRSVGSGAGFHAALAAMAAAAERGKESTRDMVARVGRASRLGERSRGTLDAGVASCSLILTTMATSMGRLLED